MAKRTTVSLFVIDIPTYIYILYRHTIRSVGHTYAMRCDASIFGLRSILPTMNRAVLWYLRNVYDCCSRGAPPRVLYIIIFTILFYIYRRQEFSVLRFILIGSIVVVVVIHLIVRFYFLQRNQFPNENFHKQQY